MRKIFAILVICVIMLLEAIFLNRKHYQSLNIGLKTKNES